MFESHWLQRDSPLFVVLHGYILEFGNFLLKCSLETKYYNIAIKQKKIYATARGRANKASAYVAEDCQFEIH